MGWRHGKRPEPDREDRCSECGHIVLFQLDHAIRFKAMRLDRDTLWCLWRRADALKIGKPWWRHLLRQYLGGMSVEQMVTYHNLQNRRSVRDTLQRLLRALWQHDGRGEWV